MSLCSRVRFGNESEIEAHIIKQIDNINLEYYLSNPRQTIDTEDRTSESYLQKIIDTDVTIGIHSNYYLFKRSICDSLIHLIQPHYPDYDIISSGHFYYPAGGNMSWHTNSNRDEPHVYVVYADEDDKSFFRYYENNKIITDYDKRGINIREFAVKSTPPYFWHCVRSDCNRYSFGFMLFKR